jgi:hypothetical protein
MGQIGKCKWEAYPDQTLQIVQIAILGLTKQKNKK